MGRTLEKRSSERKNMNRRNFLESLGAFSVLLSVGVNPHIYEAEFLFFKDDDYESFTCIAIRIGEWRKMVVFNGTVKDRVAAFRLGKKLLAESAAVQFNFKPEQIHFKKR